MGFVHLHVHTEYSLLDGAARIENLVSSAKDLNMNSIAITDHGNMFGVIDFYKMCKKYGIKPILGCEVYTASTDMNRKDPALDKSPGHLVLLAKNNRGYKNLMKIVSKGYIEGFYYKPRVDKELLRKYREGIIALSACLAGGIPSKLLKGDYQGAKNEALDMIEIFGKDNFFIEIQDHGMEEQYEINPELIRLSKELDIKLVATNDVHYVKKEDAEVHDVLLCIQTGTTVNEEKRMSFPSSEFYLKSEEEMKKTFPNIQEACENTQTIADMCNVEIEFGKFNLPDFKNPLGISNKEYLRKLCYEGLETRYSSEEKSPEEKEIIKKRVEYELTTIEEMGYVEYFLVVWDFINYAKTNDITVGPGRGSAGGSIVAFLLKITDVDPIKYNLIFERFLNPERITMPDIDIDFCPERRQEVIDYVTKKYGEEKVAQIITFGTMKAKAAVRDVGRALGVPYGEVDIIAKAIPNDIGITIEKALLMNPELNSQYETNENTRKILDFAKEVEGMARHSSTHAAGIVIAKESLDTYAPLCMGEKGVETQFTMETLEKLGLLKVDFLGLRNLTVIKNTILQIEKNRGITIDLEEMTYDDKKVFEIIGAGNTAGIFQLEGLGMTEFMKNLKPDSLEDIIAGIALFRPGPMKFIPTYIENKKNPKKIKYAHKKLEEILSVTYGCIVYQEQVLQIVRELAGYSYGKADLVRRAMSKKKMDEMLQEEKNFIFGNEEENIDGCIKRGIPEEVAGEIFNSMLNFAEYAFNRSHSAAYGIIAYQTAFLKKYYPLEYMPALLTSVVGESEKLAGYIRNAKEMGLEILPPDVNESQLNFDVKDGKISFGLIGIKGVGENAVNSLIESREKNGKSQNLFQFINGIDSQKVNKKTVESLIKAGALDKINPNRASSMANYERLLESAQNTAKNNIAGQISLFEATKGEMQGFSEDMELLNMAPFSDEIISKMEKEVTGIYITTHPLEKYRDKIKNLATTSAETIKEIEQESREGRGNDKDGEKVKIAGIITNVKTKITKNNTVMAFLEVEDLTGNMEVIVFAKKYELYQNIIKKEEKVLILGTLSVKEDENTKVYANEIENLSEAKETVSLSGTIIKLKLEEDGKLEMLKEILKKHKGNNEVILYLPEGKSMKTSKELYVEPTEEFKEQVVKLLGEKNVKIEEVVQ